MAVRGRATGDLKEMKKRFSKIDKEEAKEYQKTRKEMDSNFDTALSKQMELLDAMYTETNFFRKRSLQKQYASQTQMVEEMLQDLQSQNTRFADSYTDSAKRAMDELYKTRKSQYNDISKTASSHIDSLHSELRDGIRDVGREASDTMGGIRDSVSEFAGAIQDALNTSALQSIKQGVTDTGENYLKNKYEISRKVSVDFDYAMLNETVAQAVTANSYKLSRSEVSDIIAQSIEYLGVDNLSELGVYSDTLAQASSVLNASVVEIDKALWVDKNTDANGEYLSGILGTITAWDRGGMNIKTEDLVAAFNDESALTTLQSKSNGNEEQLYKMTQSYLSVITAGQDTASTFVSDLVQNTSSYTNRNEVYQDETLRSLANMSNGNFDLNDYYNAMESGDAVKQAQMISDAMSNINLEDENVRRVLGQMGWSDEDVNKGRSFNSIYRESFNESLAKTNDIASSASMSDELAKASKESQQGIGTTISNVITNWKPFRMVEDLFGNFNVSLANAANVVTIGNSAYKLFNKIGGFGGIKDFITNMPGKMGSLVTRAKDFGAFAKGGLSKAFAWGKSSLLPTLSNGFSSLTSTLGGLLSKAGSALSTGFSSLTGSGGLLSSLSGAVSQGISGSGVLAAGSTLMTALGSGGVLWAAVDAIRGATKSKEWLGEEKGGTVSGKVSSVIGGALGGTGKGLGGALAGAGKGALIGSFFGPIGTAVGAGIGGIFGAIGGERITKFVKGTWDKVAGFAASTWDSVKKGASSMWEGVKGVATGVWGSIKDAASGIWGGVKETASNAWGGIKSFFTGKKNGEEKGNVVTVDGSHANGLDTVPFDNYVANLHQGEAVLNSKAAQSWRDSLSRNSSGTLTIGEIRSSIVDATKTLADTVVSKNVDNLKAVSSFMADRSPSYEVIQNSMKSLGDYISEKKTEFDNGTFDFKDVLKDVFVDKKWMSSLGSIVKDAYSTRMPGLEVMQNSVKSLRDYISEKKSEFGNGTLSFKDVFKDVFVDKKWMSKLGEITKDAISKHPNFKFLQNGIDSVKNFALEKKSEFENNPIVSEIGTTIEGILSKNPNFEIMQNSMESLKGYIAEKKEAYDNGTLSVSDIFKDVFVDKKWTSEFCNIASEAYSFARKDSYSDVKRLNKKQIEDNLKEVDKKAKKSSFFSGLFDGLKGIFGGASSTDGSYRTGTDFVPHDNFVANLHQGEAVLTADQAEVYRKAASDTGSESVIWDFLKSKGLNDYAISGLMGNLKAESGLKSNNLQNSYESSLGSDSEYTAMVDSGQYTNFANDSAGYGLAQWTYSTRKQALLDMARQNNVSISDLPTQLDYLWSELNGTFSGVLQGLNNINSVRDASTIVLQQFENPAKQDVSVEEYRASLGQEVFDKMGSYDVGTQWVDGDQVALIHDKEMIVPADVNPLNVGSTQTVSVGNDDSGVVETLKWSVARMERKLDEVITTIQSTKVRGKAVDSTSVRNAFVY